jgi:hypothetical protein
MLVALQGERSRMPFGMLCRQNAIGSPNTRVEIWRAFRWAATASP